MIVCVMFFLYCRLSLSWVWIFAEVLFGVERNDKANVHKVELVDDGLEWGDHSGSEGRETHKYDHVQMAAKLSNLTDEINGLLLEALAKKLSREAVRNEMVELVRAYAFPKGDMEMIRSIKDIIIIRAAQVCNYYYRVEELMF